MPEIVRELKTAGITALIEQITDERPRINKYVDYNEILLTDSQNTKLTAYIERLIAAEKNS